MRRGVFWGGLLTGRSVESSKTIKGSLNRSKPGLTDLSEVTKEIKMGQENKTETLSLSLFRGGHTTFNYGRFPKRDSSLREKARGAAEVLVEQIVKAG